MSIERQKLQEEIEKNFEVLFPLIKPLVSSQVYESSCEFVDDVEYGLALTYILMDLCEYKINIPIQTFDLLRKLCNIMHFNIETEIRITKHDKV